MNIIGHRKIYLSISAIVATLAIVSIVVFGFKPAIDFKGGTLWQFKLTDKVTPAEVQKFLSISKLNLGEIRINQETSDKSFFARFKEIKEDEHENVKNELATHFGGIEELSFQAIGPSIGDKLKSNAIKAVIFAIIAVSLYIAFAFRKVSRPISSWKYGIVTMATLFHDVIIPTGLLTLLGYLNNIEVDSNFVVALLVIMGFSVHDTIVVFDRIRENLILDKGKVDFGETINKSVNQTMARSINTSLTLIVVLVALILVGPLNLKYFILTLLVGVSVGVYSSVFVASPLLLVWQKLTLKPKK